MADKSTVGDYVSLQRGTTYKGNLVGKPGPALLGLGSIRPGGGFRDGDYKTYGGECPKKLMLFPGDLFVSLKGATKDGKMIGSVARVPSTVPSGRLTQDTVKLEFHDSDQEIVAFLYWLLRTPQYRNYCAGRATGSAVVALSRDDFLAYPVPPLTPARLQLVKLLELLDEKIELNRCMNHALDAITRSLFKSWFVDFDPVRAKAEGRGPSLPDPVADLFPNSFEDSELGEVPKDWGLRNLDQEFTLTMGQSPPGDTYNELGEGTPFFQGRTDFGFRFPRRRVYCTAPSRMAQVGDTLVSVRAPVGDINMAAEQCCIGRGVAAVRHGSGSRSYTYYFLESLRQIFNGFEAEGTVFGSINKKAFHAIRTVTPPPDVVAAFERISFPMDERVRVGAEQIETLASLRDTLLPRLISGELRISDVEKLIEARI
jgi:restriction endonuclease S subunit